MIKVIKLVLTVLTVTVLVMYQVSLPSASIPVGFCIGFSLVASFLGIIQIGCEGVAKVD